MRKLILASAAAAAIVALPASASAATKPPTGSQDCTGQVSEKTYRGDVNVPSGAFCELDGTTVRGKITIQPGAQFLALIDSEVRGRISGSDFGSFVTYYSTVLGGLSVKTLSQSAIACETDFLGTTSFTASSRVTLGNRDVILDDGSRGCKGNRFAGSLTVSDSPGAVRLDDNRALGNVTINTNKDNVLLRGNDVYGTLACSGNTFPVEGEGNRAARVTGQCAAVTGRFGR